MARLGKEERRSVSVIGAAIVVVALAVAFLYSGLSTRWTTSESGSPSSGDTSGIRLTVEQEQLPPQDAPGLREVSLIPETFLGGHVLDSKDRPISGATIFASEDSDLATEWYTDRVGQFRLGPYQHGALVSLVISADGFNESRLNSIVAPTNDLTVTLLRNGFLHGMILANVTQTPVSMFQIETHRAEDIFQGRIRSSNYSRQWNFENADGRFEIRDLAPGEWLVIARAKGYQLGEVPGINVLEGQTTEEVVLLLDKGQLLSGIVIDEETTLPISSATVRVLSQHLLERRHLSRLPVTLFTDQGGSFEFDNLPPGEVTIAVSAEGYASYRRIVGADNETAIEITLSRGSLIHGVVFLADGITPAVGRVRLSKEGASGGDTTYSDEDGRFEFVRNQPGLYVISAESPLGRATEKRIILSKDEKDIRVDLVFESKGSVRGHVSGLLAGEKDRTTVAILKDRVYVTRTHTDEDGGFVFHGLPPGPMVIEVETRLGRRATKSIELPELGNAIVDFHLDSGARLFGKITRGGRPADVIRLKAIPLDGQSDVGTTRSVGGQYTFVGLANGNYKVNLGMGSAISAYVDGDTQLDIELSDLVISGFVHDAEQGGPIANVAINVANSASVLAEGRTNHVGSFEFIGFDPGEYRVSAYKSGYDISFHSVVAEKPSSEIVIVLRATQGQRIRVTDAATGLPLRRVLVRSASVLSDDFIYIGLNLDENGVGFLASSLSGHDIMISGFTYESEVIYQWDGSPMDIALTANP